MQCPTCRQNTPDLWLSLDAKAAGVQGHYTSLSSAGLLSESLSKGLASDVRLDYMYCANPECGELVIRLHETRSVVVGDRSESQTNTRVVRPGGAQRPVDPLVPEPFRRDYREAASILDMSPRMSAVLSRRILADILEEYAGQTDFGLNDRIKGFVADTSQPSSVRENLHYLAEIGNFSAHTQKTDQAEIVDVDRVEAEWTLDVIDRLFDHFIVGPERDKKMRQAMDKKIKEAGRRDIPQLPDSGGTT